MDTNEASSPFKTPLEETGIVYSPPLPVSARLGVPAISRRQRGVSRFMGPWRSLNKRWSHGAGLPERAGE